MGEKSFVTMLTTFCPRCEKEHETGELAMDTRIRNGKLVENFERTTCVGIQICPDCFAKMEEMDSILLFSAEEKPKGGLELQKCTELFRPFVYSVLENFPKCEGRLCRVQPNLLEQITNLAQELQDDLNKRKQEAEAKKAN